MSISWGVRQRFKFDSCGPLVNWTPPMISAVYAITYKQDPKNKPKSHTVLYFGEGADLSQQTSTYHRDVLDMWKDNGCDINELFVFVHPMPGASTANRSTVHYQLLFEYRPNCNSY